MELHRAYLVIATALAAMAIGPLAAPAQAAKKGRGEHHDVTLMTRNLYLGSDLSGVFNAKTLQEVADEAGEIFNDVVANNFPLRAQALARGVPKEEARSGRPAGGLPVPHRARARPRPCRQGAGQLPHRG